MVRFGIEVKSRSVKRGPGDFFVIHMCLFSFYVATLILLLGIITPPPSQHAVTPRCVRTPCA